VQTSGGKKTSIEPQQWERERKHFAKRDSACNVGSLAVAGGGGGGGGGESQGESKGGGEGGGGGGGGGGGRC